MKKGKLIVIEGRDGAGKATQTKMLVDYLRSKKIPVETISFPRYKDSFYGKLVGRFLQGEFGKLNDISPYLASLPYALDRKSAQPTIVQWLKEGKIVIADRYVTSSIAHQAAKLPEEKREEFINWLKQMEYEENKMPIPDIVIFLFVPASETHNLTRNRNRAMDIADRNIAHQKHTSEVYQWLAYNEPTWKQVDCLDKNRTIRTKKEIHTEILQILRESLKIEEV